VVRATARPEGLQAWTALCALVDTVRIAVNRDLQCEAGLTLAENLVLCRVAMAPQQRLRMVEIAQLLGVAKSAITKTVDRLEDRGLLTRERGTEDRRTVYALLTERGQRTFIVAQPAFVSSIDRHFTRALDRSEIHTLSQLASRAPIPAADPGTGSRPARSVSRQRRPPRSRAPRAANEKTSR
jgi:DNA-binding MarR family transcriptional regulator